MPNWYPSENWYPNMPNPQPPPQPGAAGPQMTNVPSPQAAPPVSGDRPWGWRGFEGPGGESLDMWNDMSPREQQESKDRQRMQEYINKNPEFARRIQGLQDQKMLQWIMNMMGFGGSDGRGGAGMMSARAR